MMNVSNLVGRTFTVAVMETFTIDKQLESQYFESMDDHPHTVASFAEFLADLMVPVLDKSETSHIVISENNKEQ